MPSADLTRHIDDVRRFNRFYTQRIGVLADTYQGSPFSLTEARVLYELVATERQPASAIARRLGLDDGYLSRILRGFEKDGLVRRQALENDARQSLLSVSAKGRQKYGALESATRAGIGALLEKLQNTDRARLVGAMNAISTILADEQPTRKVELRAPQPGDYGWMVARHALLYAQEYGWTGPQFEGLCAEIVAGFAKKHDAARERCWIATVDGEYAGSIMLVRDSDTVARIRLLLVEPTARGLGIGRRLTEESIAFARAAGYRRITLWTHSVLTAARDIYKKAGFTLTATEPHNDWGKRLVGETWDLKP
jgi:DNA-binding MarR family transcriptional regulator/GNAT superfamily N-acetyltransferase